MFIVEPFDTARDYSASREIRRERGGGEQWHKIPRIPVGSLNSISELAEEKFNGNGQAPHDSAPDYMINSLSDCKREFAPRSTGRIEID